MPKGHSANTRAWKSRSRREQRRAEAKARQEAWERLSFEQQLQSLDNRGLDATKQRAKIAERIKKRAVNQPKPKEEEAAALSRGRRRTR